MHSMLSIIVPSRGRLAQLRRLLDCLAQQTGLRRDDAFEVVVGLDGHTPADADTLPRDFAFPVLYLPLPPVGISAAKNAAVAAARGDVLLFVNDDIEPERGFVAAHLAAQSAGHAVVLGASPFVRWPDQTVFDELVARTRMIFFYNELVDGAAYDFRHAWNLNLSVHRRLIDQAPGPYFPDTGDALSRGPFCAALQPVFFDDVEFAQRLIGDANTVRYCAAAQAPHRHRYDFRGYFEREALLGVMSRVLAEINPACHRAIFHVSPRDLLAAARESLPRDIVDGQRLVQRFHDAAHQPWADHLPADYCETLYALHLPLKRRAFRCGLTTAAEAHGAAWHQRPQLAGDALRRDAVFASCPYWKAGSADAPPVPPRKNAATPRINAMPTR